MQKPTLAFTFLVTFTGCGDNPQLAAPDAPTVQIDAPAAKPNLCKQLGLEPATMRADLAWYGNNRGDLTAWADSLGCASAGFDAAKRPVAMFDWDNTISKNDFGDAITYYFV